MIVQEGEEAHRPADQVEGRLVVGRLHAGGLDALRGVLRQIPLEDAVVVVLNRACTCLTYWVGQKNQWLTNVANVRQNLGQSAAA